MLSSFLFVLHQGSSTSHQASYVLSFNVKFETLSYNLAAFLSMASCCARKSEDT